MNKLRHLLAQLPWIPVILITALLGFAPFVPEPHLWEKLKMLGNGTLTRPIDIFDLFWHSWPFALLAAKLLWGRGE
ncbi:MAG TPA: RND transporter [Thiolinea sp.]|nr:RND transporter [Thiolinea sp.]